MTIIIFILILGLLVLVHEWGHFICARKTGMRVEEFGFGFPPRAFGVYKNPVTGKFKWVWGKGKSSLKETVGGKAMTGDEFPNTVYSLNWLPLGGFCKIKGENGEAMAEPDSFGFQKAWKRALVLVAGVSMNFLLACILLGIGFMIGLPADMSMGVDDKAIVVEPAQVMVQAISKDSPADKAGLAYGDTILSLDGQAVVSTENMITYIQAHQDDEIAVVVQRVEEQLTYNLTPELLRETDEYEQIGLILADAGIIRYPWYVAIYKGFIAGAIGVINIVFSFYIVIKNLILGQGLVFEVAGPVGIAVMVGDSLRLGVNYLINLTAMLSLVLAVINILPIPALDGGRILFIGIEKLIRRPVPIKYEQMAHTIGFVLLMALIVVVTWRDVAGLF